MSRIVTGILIAVFVFCAKPVGAQPNVEFELENGLQIILLPLPAAKTNALVVLYDFGNYCDPPGQSGMAHMAEHLYVTSATSHTPARDVNQYMSDYPDGWNAQTGDEYTVFAAVFQADRTESELSDAADRMRKIKVSQTDIDRELPRMEAELDNMYRQFAPLAISNHGRHNRVPLAHGGRRGGTIQQLKDIDVKAMSEWLDRYYKPGNATLILAGVFDPDEIRKTIREQFGSIDRGNKPVAGTKPALGKQRIFEIEVAPSYDPQGNSPLRVGYTFRTPGADDPLYAAFLVHTTRLQIAGRKVAGPQMQNMPYLFRPLDDPDFFYAMLPAGEDESTDQALNRLEGMLKEHLAAGLKPFHVQQTENMLSLFLGTREIPSAMLAVNPYGAAFSAGRRHQLGIESADLKQQFESLDEEQMRLAAEKFFGKSNRVTVIARTADKRP